jgi:ATP-binding cassette subfamily B protein
VTGGARDGDLVLYRRLLHDARPWWPHVTAVFLLSLLSAPLALLLPLPLQIVVDCVVGAHPAPAYLRTLLPARFVASPAALLGTAAGLLVTVALLQQVEGFGSWLLQLYTGEKLVLDVRSRLFRHLQRLSLRYHDTMGTGDSLYRIQSDASAMQYVIISGLVPFVTSAVTLAGMIWVTVRIDRRLALAALVVVPILFTLTEIYRRRVRDRWRVVKESESAAMSIVQEVLAAVRVVKAFGQEEREGDRFVRAARRSLAEQMKVVLAESAFGLLVALTLAGGSAAVLFIGARHVQSGALTLGSLLLVMAYLAQLYRPLETISRKVASLQASLASAGRVFALLDRVPDVVERRGARPLARAAGRMSLRDVSFAYGEGRPALEGVSLEVPAGACVGVAGPTGAGKTTLLCLLARLADPTAGQIRLDGVDLRDYRLADLRRQFAIVLQEPVLFSTTIAENIAYGRPGASREEIVEAARAAYAHDFVMRLPQGYATVAGERGMGLSGGERQRIALARAFLMDAPILLLDEPTSAVDVRSEAIILDAIRRLMRGRTTFMVAHRLHTLAGCDLRLEIAHGRVRPGSERLAAGAGS